MPKLGVESQVIKILGIMGWRTLKKNGILEARLNRKVLSEYLCEEIFNPHKLSVENYELDKV